MGDFEKCLQMPVSLKNSQEFDFQPFRLPSCYL